MRFAKYEGAGNDFILIDDRKGEVRLEREEIRRLCDRHYGIGADGLILLQEATSAPGLCMRMFNRDGSEAEGCGNGVRCCFQFAVDLGMPAQRTAMVFGGRTLFMEPCAEGVLVEMGAVQELRLNLSVGGYCVDYADSGVPHAVLFVEDVEHILVDEVGWLLRNHPYFAPRGTNVNFATVLGDGSVSVRTYERGVEGETRACGTGAVAVATTGAERWGWKSPVRIRTRGGSLLVRFDTGYENTVLVGPARSVFVGEFFL